MSVVIVGTLDTKSEEIGFAREVLTSHGVDVHIIDAGIMGDPSLNPDTSASAVAEEAGATIDSLRESGDRGKAIQSMGEGAASIVGRMHENGQVDGVLGLGGSGNTSIATRSMRNLPIGVPKLMLSTVASGDVEPYIGVSDIMMQYSVADIEGINQLSAKIITNAALAMIGMVTLETDMSMEDRPTVAISMFGVTTPGVKKARKKLEERGYETIVFHATGTGGQAMESLIKEGMIDAVLDITTTEWADEVVGGVLSAGPDRLGAAAEVGIPQVVSGGALDMVNFGPRESVPNEFEERLLHVHNPEVTLMRTTIEENQTIGEQIANKLNSSSGPAAFVFPHGGLSMLDEAGNDFYDEDADIALLEALQVELSEHIELIEVEGHINDESVAEVLVDKLEEYIADSK